MTYLMPTLPYEHDALGTVISTETMDYHYGKHLQTYVNNLNALVPGTEFEGKTVEQILRTASPGAIFNNAGQVINHTLYFLQFTPKPKSNRPHGELAEAIERDFGSFEEMQKKLNAASISLFGSGWGWLSKNKDGKLEITQELNGSNPICKEMIPLLGFDVWEHAYYLDYQNRRADHIGRLWEIIDWTVVEERFNSSLSHR
ncbi:MAG: superoxide dismutase [Bacteroides sp.]